MISPVKVRVKSEFISHLQVENVTEKLLSGCECNLYFSVCLVVCVNMFSFWHSADNMMRNMAVRCQASPVPMLAQTPLL